MIQIPTLQEIYSRTRADAQTMMDASKPIPTLSMLNVLIAVFSGAIKGVYGHLLNVATWILPDRAQGRFLDRLLTIYEVPVSTGSPAQGSITCAGTVGVTIPVGTTVQTIDGSKYNTMSEGVIGANGLSELIIITCTKSGTAGNYDGTELTFTSPITNINSVATLSLPCVGGSSADTESTLREKLLNKIRKANTLGLGSDYERLALTVAGVGKVWAVGGEYYTGPNTVVVTLATRENLPVSNETLVAVQALFADDEYHIPGIVVSVENLDTTPVDIDVTIYPNNSTYRTNVTNCLTALFKEGVSPSEILKIADVRSAISGGGVSDYEITRWAFGGNDYALANIQPPVGTKFSLGTVTFG